MKFLVKIFGKCDSVVRAALHRYGIKLKRINRRSYFEINDYKLEQIRYFIKYRKEKDESGNKQN